MAASTVARVSAMQRGYRVRMSALSLWLLLCVGSGCTPNSPDRATQASRAKLLSEDLARVSAPMAVVQAYAIWNAGEACRYAAIPESAAAALRGGAGASDALERIASEYARRLSRIYAEERAMCQAFRRAVNDTAKLVDGALAADHEPPAAYVFYVTPRGLMRDARARRDKLGGSSLSAGFREGRWLGFEVAPPGAVLVGLFQDTLSCQRQRTRLGESGSTVSDCRNWVSEPLHALRWP